jgi:hypothetical protein
MAKTITGNLRLSQACRQVDRVRRVDYRRSNSRFHSSLYSLLLLPLSLPASISWVDFGCSWKEEETKKRNDKDACESLIKNWKKYKKAPSTTSDLRFSPLKFQK